MYKKPSDQAKMLSDYILLTAYRYGVPVDAKRMLKVIRDDVFSPEKTDFTVDHRCLSHSWFLDMTECCALAARLAREIGEDKIAEELRSTMTMCGAAALRDITRDKVWIP